MFHAITTSEACMNEVTSSKKGTSTVLGDQPSAGSEKPVSSGEFCSVSQVMGKFRIIKFLKNLTTMLWYWKIIQFFAIQFV
jgi:hypothetical protein